MINFILRLISITVVIFVVVPLYFLVCSTKCLFTIVNNFTYHAFVGFDEQVLGLMETYGLPMKYFGVFKVLLLVLTPFSELFKTFHEGVKSIKF